MATPRDLLGYRQPSLLGYRQQGPTWTQAEVDANVIAQAQRDRGSNSLVQGWQSTSAGLNAGDLAELAQAAEQAGDKEQAAGLLRRMRVAQAQSQAYAPDTRSVGDIKLAEEGGLGRAVDWAGGALGSMGRSAAPAMGAGLVGAGVGAVMAGPAGAVAGGLRGAGMSLLRSLATAAPTALVSYDQLRGEQVAGQYDDAEVMKRSADERASQASLTAALQTLPEIFLPTHAVGALVERQIAGQVGKRVANTVLDTVAEGGTEALQQELGYRGQQALGSTAERNSMDYIDAFAAGAVGGAGVSGASNVLGAVGDRIATSLKPVAGEPTDREALGGAAGKVADMVKDVMSKPWSQIVAEVMTPDKAIADSLNGNKDPEAIAAAVTELDQTIVATAESMADDLMQQDRVSDGDKARLAQLKGSMADPVARNEVGVIAIKTKAVEVLDTAFKTVTGYVKSGVEKARSKFSMEGMDIAPLVDTLAPIFGEKAPGMAQKWVDLASKYEGITSAEAITDSKLADSLDEIADVLGAMGKNGEGIKKALAGVGMTSMTKLIDELQSVPGAQADLGKQDSFLRTMLQKGQRGVSGKKVARLIDRLAPTIDNMPKEERTGILKALSVAFGSDEAADGVLKYYAELHRAKPSETARKAFEGQTSTLSPNAGSSFERPSQAEAEAAEGGLTEGDFSNLAASYRDANPARPFFAMSDRKDLKAEAAKGGRVAGMDEYVARTGRSAAEAFGRIKTDLEQRLKAARNRDKGWLTQELERAVASGADLRTRQELEKRLVKAEVRTDLPKLERQYAKMVRDTPDPESMDPKRFDKALSRYRVVLRDEKDTQASDEDVHRFQRLLRVRKQYKPPAKPKDETDTEAKADYEDRLAAYEAKVGAIDETTITFTKTDGKKLKTSAESMAYASQVKGGDLQKFLSAVSSMLDRKDIAGVELPSTLVVFREGEKRKRRTLAEMRGIANVRKQLQARAESGNPKQKAFAERALALIDASVEQQGARETAVLQNTQLSGKGTRRERAAEESIGKRKEARDDAARDTAIRAQQEAAGVNEESALQTLITGTHPRLSAARRALKENPDDQNLQEEVANLRSEERVLSEMVRSWLDKAFPMPDRQEYTSRLADDVQMEGGYTEEELQAAYLDEVVGVLEERLAVVRPALTKAELKKLYELNNQISATENTKQIQKLTDEVDKIASRVDPRRFPSVVKGLQSQLADKKIELNELMDSTGRNPRDGSRRVKDNPSREPSAAVQTELDELAQSLMSAELDPKKVTLVELSFQGKIEELRKKGGVDAAEMLRAYQFAMGRLRRIKDKTRGQAQVVFDKVTGKQKDPNPISYVLGPEGKPQALPLDPDTSYGRVEPDMRSEVERSESAQDHAAKARRVADAKTTVSTEKREDMTTLERFNPLQRASFERRKVFAKRMLQLQKAVKEKRAEKQKELNPEAAALGAEADKKNLAAREAMKGMGRAPVAVKGELNSTMLRTVPGEALAMMTSQLMARQAQVDKVVGVLTETLKGMANSVDLLGMLERIGTQTPAIPKGFTGAREGRQSSNAAPITKAPEIAESDTAAIDKEIAKSRARLKLAKSKRPNEETWPAGYEEKLQKRKAAALERASVLTKPKWLFHGTRAGESMLIDARGNLVLKPSKNFGGKTNGVSFTDDPASAKDYATRIKGGGPKGFTFEGAKIIRIDSAALSGVEAEAMNEWADYSGKDIVIPRGSYSVEPVARDRFFLKDSYLAAGFKEYVRDNYRGLEREAIYEDPAAAQEAYLSDIVDAADSAKDVTEAKNILRDEFGHAYPGVTQPKQNAQSSGAGPATTTKFSRQGATDPELAEWDRLVADAEKDLADEIEKRDRSRRTLTPQVQELVDQARTMPEDIFMDVIGDSLPPMVKRAVLTALSADEDVGIARSVLEAIRKDRAKHLEEYAKTPEGRRAAMRVVKQNAQSTAGQSVPTTFAELQAKLEKMRGPDIKVTVQDLLSGYGKYERNVHGPLVKRLITIAHAAPNKMSVLYHEALHDFFAELGKDKASLRIKQQLLDAASTGHVQAQLRELLKNEPAALAQLSDPEERLAYMFQFRMANPEMMRIGPNTDTLFKRIAAAIRKFTGMITELEKAEQILIALYDGRLADPSTAAKVMAEWNTFGDNFERLAGPVKQAIEKTFSASTEQLRAMNIPALNTIADLFENNAKKSGLLIARAQSGGIWRDKLERLLAGHDEKEIREAMLHMQSMKDPVTELHNKLAGFFKDIRDWQIEKGVLQFTGKFVPTGRKDANGAPIFEPDYKPMGKVKRYFPRVVDLDMLTKKGPEFSRLLQKHMGYSQKQADDVLHQLRVGDQMMVKPRGVTKEAGFSPYAQSVISRELILDEAGATALAEAGFWSQDFAGVMTRYIDQAVHRAEYTERFGNIGEKLDAMMEQAEVEGATKAQLERAKRLISGLDGTIHHGMNPTIKQTQMALLTLQNLILLPLAVFSQLIDPLGIAVRSGDVRDAGAAYKRVLTDIVNWASPKPDRAREMAQIIGAVQNDSVLQAMGMVHNGMYMSAGLRKINSFMFKYNGMQGINNSFRTAAVTAAEKYILEYRNDARRMEELDLKPSDITESKPGEIDYTSEKIQQALFRFADGAVVRPNAAHRPLWMSDPRFMLVAHLKQFAFSFQEVILKRVAHEKSYGNSGPLKILAMYAPIMIAADMAKWALTGNLPQNWSLLHLFAHGVHRSGLLGVGTFGADVVNDVASERSAVLGFLGPTAQHLGLLASWIGGGVPVEDVIDRSVPLARLFTK